MAGECLVCGEEYLCAVRSIENYKDLSKNKEMLAHTGVEESQ